jgi:hypothetical protein
LLHLEEKQQKIAEFLIGSIEDDGYLRRDIPSVMDDLAFRQNIQTTLSTRCVGQVSLISIVILFSDVITLFYFQRIRLV